MQRAASFSDFISQNFRRSNAEFCQTIPVELNFRADLLLSSFTNLSVANGRTWQSKIKTRCKSVVIFRIVPLHCMNNLNFKLLNSA